MGVAVAALLCLYPPHPGPLPRGTTRGTGERAWGGERRRLWLAWPPEEEGFEVSEGPAGKRVRYSQFSTDSPGTRESSPTLSVTSTAPKESAWAAIQ